MALSGDDALALAKSYVKKSMQGSGAIGGADGFSPIITEDSENTDEDYRLDITTATGSFQTPNLKGEPGKDGLPGADGFTPKITENPENTENVYKLNIANADGTFTTPNLKGSDGTDLDSGETQESNMAWYPNVSSDGVISWSKTDTDTQPEPVNIKGEPGGEGRSITNISSDENGNVTATFSDGTTENIGSLSIDVSADFLTSGGFGNLRYMNGNFQYFDKDTSTWVGTSVSPENVYVFNMTPQPMEFIFGVYDHKSGHYKLKWKEPKDTVIDGQVACVVEKVFIVKKLDSEPENPDDGEVVAEIKRVDFGVHENAWFVEDSFSPEMGNVWHYKAFPYATTGFYGNSSMNDTGGITAKDYELYGFVINQNESDPDSMISYIEDNQKFRSAYMNYGNDSFRYGDWRDVFFMDVKPCMLKYDGTVDYFLNPDDYASKEDGAPSDVANTAYGGNAMVQFPKVYWKVVDNGDNTANIYISDKKVDDSFICWSHIDNNGNEIPYCYMPIYNGSNVNNVLRSLSGRVPMTSQTAQVEINYAKANNPGSDILWYTEVTCDRMMVNILLYLIGKSTDTRRVFGSGNNQSYVGATNTGVKNTGTMNGKGLFWGNQDNITGVKVFGIEHWWGSIWRRIAGWINDKGTQKIKMTYGQSDGSTVDGYNLDGTGYIMVPGSTPSGTSGGYVNKVLFTENGLIPVTASGSATTYYTSGMWFNNGQVDYALAGGCSDDGLHVGALCLGLNGAVSLAYRSGGASISCKPLAEA